MVRLCRYWFRRLFPFVLGSRAVRNLPLARPLRAALAVGKLEDRLYPGGVTEVLFAAALGGVASGPIMAIAGLVCENALIGGFGDTDPATVLREPHVLPSDTGNHSIPFLRPEATPPESRPVAVESSMLSSGGPQVDPFDDLIPDGVGILPWGGVSVDLTIPLPSGTPEEPSSSPPVPPLDAVSRDNVDRR